MSDYIIVTKPQRIFTVTLRHPLCTRVVLEEMKLDLSFICFGNDRVDAASSNCNTHLMLNIIGLHCVWGGEMDAHVEIHKLSTMHSLLHLDTTRMKWAGKKGDT
jgi:hypothetical protein